MYIIVLLMCVSIILVVAILNEVLSTKVIEAAVAKTLIAFQFQANGLLFAAHCKRAANQRSSSCDAVMTG
jgi:hypothetical protein